ncbi:hypothetical protein BDZ91DRAFT_750230 [Kalaharituber pfeilii]|nr:hypothetical protein BDZ91DRAFT_750230 [Kalaharituber pfeilii]
MPDTWYTTEGSGGEALNHGYEFQGVLCYVFTDFVPGTVPALQTFSSTLSTHFFTTHLSAYKAAIKSGGYKGHRVCWYMFPDSADKPRDNVVALYSWYNASTHERVWVPPENTKGVHLNGFIKEGLMGYGLKAPISDSAFEMKFLKPLYQWRRS